MCSVTDSIELAAMLSGVILGLSQFQFIVFICYAIHRILRRILR